MVRLTQSKNYQQVIISIKPQESWPDETRTSPILTATEEQSPWCKVPSPYWGLALTERGTLSGSCVVAPGTEPYTGEWQFTLLHIQLHHRLPEDAALYCLVQWVRERSPSPDGWITITIPFQGRLESAARACGFEAVDMTVRRTVQERPWNPGNVAVRRAEPQDRTSLKTLSQECLPALVPSMPHTPCERVLKRCREHWPTYAQEGGLDDPYLEFLIAEDRDHNFLGYIILDTSHPEPYINDLAVTFQARGGSVARSLLAAALSLESAQNAGAVRAQVASANRNCWLPALRVAFQRLSRRWVLRFGL